jgi:hypothetical protein
LVALKPDRKVFFSEEKKQKTFANSGVCAAGEGRDSTRKSLLVLFFRKERLPGRNSDVANKPFPAACGRRAAGSFPHFSFLAGG